MIRLWFPASIGALALIHIVWAGLSGLVSLYNHSMARWILVALPLVWMSLALAAIYWVSHVPSMRVRAGVEVALVVSTLLGAVLGYLASVFSFVLADVRPQTATDLLIIAGIFSLGASLSLVPGTLLGVLVAWLCPKLWVNHLSPFDRPLATG